MNNLTTANTAKELFSALNALRIENNKPAYKSCKESKAIMLEKIHALRINTEDDIDLENEYINAEIAAHIINERHDKEILVANDDYTLPENAHIDGLFIHEIIALIDQCGTWGTTNEEEITANLVALICTPTETPETPEAIIETPETPIETPDTFTLADLARELEINPKVARRKLRKIVNIPGRINEKKWVFANKFKTEIETLIK